MREQATALREALIEYQAKRLPLVAVVAQAKPLLQDVARQAAYRYRLLHAQDDLFQNLWVLFAQEIAQKYDPDKPLLPLVMTYARMLALTEIKRLREAAQAQEEGDDEHPLEHLLQQQQEHDPIEQQERELDRQRALAALADRFAALDASAAAPAKRASVAPPSAPRKTRVLGADHLELVAIRRQLGLTREEYAGQLGIRKHRLESYEKGRTMTVPPHILMRARELAAEADQEFAKAGRYYAGKSMPEILQEWAGRLALDYADNQALADALDTTRTTIRRWKANQTRPTVRALIDYEKRILTKRVERNAILLAEK